MPSLDYKEVIEILIYESRNSHLGADNLGWGGNLLFYINTFASSSNLLFILLIPIGLYSIFKSKEKISIILFYGFFYWITLSKLALHWERWSLPMYLSPLFLISYGISYLWGETKETKWVKYLSLAILSIVFVHQFVFSLYNSIRLTFPDSRYIALQYCSDQGINKNHSIYEGYTPFRPRGRKEIFDEDFSNKEMEYIILSSQTYERYFNEGERYIKEVGVYNLIREENELIKEFIPSKTPENTRTRLLEIFHYFLNLLNINQLDRTNGPTIQIYINSK